MLKIVCIAVPSNDRNLYSFQDNILKNYNHSMMHFLLDTNLNDIKRNLSKPARFLRILPPGPMAEWNHVPESIFKDNTPVRSWRAFAREVRNKNTKLLLRLYDFPSSILVTGCQRSGTTMMSRIITNSSEMTKYAFGHDDELAAALILSGYVDHTPNGRYCFQTTYLNECYPEYSSHRNQGHKIIWLLRNPYSVVYSMLYIWSRRSMNELFDSCGANYMDEVVKHNFQLKGRKNVPAIIRASLSYKAKVSQLFNLIEYFGHQNIMLLDYDELVLNRYEILPLIYSYLGLNYQDSYAEQINPPPNKNYKILKKKEKLIVKRLCLPTYMKAKFIKERSRA